MGGTAQPVMAVSRSKRRAKARDRRQAARRKEARPCGAAPSTARCSLYVVIVTTLLEPMNGVPWHSTATGIRPYGAQAWQDTAGEPRAITLLDEGLKGAGAPPKDSQASGGAECAARPPLSSKAARGAAVRPGQRAPATHPGGVPCKGRDQRWARRGSCPGAKCGRRPGSPTTRARCLHAATVRARAPHRVQGQQPSRLPNRHLARCSGRRCAHGRRDAKRDASSHVHRGGGWCSAVRFHTATATPTCVSSASAARASRPGRAPEVEVALARLCRALATIEQCRLVGQRRRPTRIVPTHWFCLEGLGEVGSPRPRPALKGGLALGGRDAAGS